VRATGDSEIDEGRCSELSEVGVRVEVVVDAACVCEDMGGIVARVG